MAGCTAKLTAQGEESIWADHPMSHWLAVAIQATQQAVIGAKYMLTSFFKDVEETAKQASGRRKGEWRT